MVTKFPKPAKVTAPPTTPPVATLAREALLTGPARPREERRREVYERTLSDPVWRKP